MNDKSIVNTGQKMSTKIWTLSQKTKMVLLRRVTKIVTHERVGRLKLSRNIFQYSYNHFIPPGTL